MLQHRARRAGRGTASSSSRTTDPSHQEERMQTVHDGQCGLSTHFGEHHAATPQQVQIRRSHEAPETMLDECGHPRHAPLHLKVTPLSGCDGFEPAR
jgi:hypothetical protein